MQEELALDGNAVGGLLGELFVPEITSAAARCDGCGAVEAFGALRAYVNAPGVVIRCLHCQQVVLRVVQDGHRVWLDVRGASWLQFGPAEVA